MFLEKSGQSFFIRGMQLLQKNLKYLKYLKLKSKISKDKKSLQTKIFFSLQYLNLDLLIKHLVTFKKWDGVIDDKF